MLARVFDANHTIGIHSTTNLRNRYLDIAAQVAPGDRLVVGAHLIDRSFSDHQSAVLAGTRTEVDQMVGSLHCLLVVLDDDDGVAEITQLAKSVQQASVVALMQSDRRLVENVQHTDEPRSDLSRQTNPLRLTARE